MKKHRIRIIPIILVFLTVVLGCKNNSTEKAEKEPAEESRYIVEIEAIDYAFKMPSEIKSGWVTFKFKNTGHEMHFGMLLKFNDSVSETDFNTFAGDPSPEAFEKYIKEPPVLIGGPGFHAGGQKSETTLFLEPGSYAFLCNTRTADGRMHRDLGMRKYFKITNEEAEAEEPIADLNINLERYYIDVEGKIAEGRHTVAIDHKGGDTFDVHLVRLNDTSTIPETLKFMEEFQEPTQALFSGGAEQKSVDRKSYVTIDFEPGDYAWMSHEYGAMGMIKEFSITEDGSTESFRPMAESEFNEIPINIDEDSVYIAEQVGKGLVKLVIENTSSEEHIIAVGRLEEGKTFDDYLGYIDKVLESRKMGTPLEAENPRTGYKIVFSNENELKFDLDPGTYVLFCDAQDEEGNYIHLRKNEIASFEVR